MQLYRVVGSTVPKILLVHPKHERKKCALIVIFILPFYIELFTIAFDIVIAVLTLR